MSKQRVESRGSVTNYLKTKSGSVISPVIARQLLDRNIPTIVILIGDSSDGLSAKNTMNTLASFNQIATKVSKKPLSMVYINNEEFSDKSKREAENETNKRISNTLATISLFLSGVNEDIDAQDMVGIIDQSHYKGSLDIQPGLYGLATFSGNIDLPTTAIATVGRTLVPKGISPDINMTLLHHKSGQVTEENPLEIYDGQFPLHMVSYSGFFTVEREMLHKVVKDYENIMSSIQNVDVNGTDDSEFDDDTGLVL